MDSVEGCVLEREEGAPQRGGVTVFDVAACGI